MEKDQKTLDAVTGAVEVFAAQLESGDTVDDVSDDVIGTIGEERVREGEVFVEWFEEHVGGFLLESGHFPLSPVHLHYLHLYTKKIIGICAEQCL